MVMTPIYDDNPFTQPMKPIVTWCLIAANLAVFFYEAAAPQAGLDRMIDTFSLTPAALRGEIAPRGSLAAIGNAHHLSVLPCRSSAISLGNMIFLWVFGDDIERALGRVRYLIFYLAMRRHRRPCLRLL